MDGLDHLLDMVMAPSGGSELLFGSISSTGQVYLDASDTPLDGAPPSLVRLERGRRFAATLQGKTLLIVGLLGGSDSTPVATILPYGSGEIPQGYLLCNGQDVSRAAYADLFSKIGTTYGAGDGSTTFSVPNLRGRVVVGHSAAEPEFNNLGQRAGEKAHTLTMGEIPAHGGHIDGYTGTLAAYLAAPGGLTSYTDTAHGWKQYRGNEIYPYHFDVGGGGSHNNLPPYLVGHYIIRT